MAKIRKTLKGVVYVGNGIKPLKLRAGDEVPKGVKVGAHLLESKETKADEEQETDQETSLEFPGEDATRAELDAYAESIGIDPKEYKNKDELLAALQ